MKTRIAFAATVGAFVMSTLAGCANSDETGCLAAFDMGGDLGVKVVDYEKRGNDGYTTVKFKNGRLGYCRSYGGSGADRMIQWQSQPYL